MIEIAVVGGGISGIAACYYIEKFIGGRARISLFERSKKAGGCVKTVYEGDFVFECGPDCFIIEKPAPLVIARELGNENEVVSTLEAFKGTYIFADGRLHRMPEGLMTLVPTKFWPFVTTSLFTFTGKFRMALDLFLPRGKFEDETLASFVRRRLGEEALYRLATPLVAGIYGADPENMSLKATFPKFLEMEKNYRSLILAMLDAKRKASRNHKVKKKKINLTYFLSFRKGMGQLPYMMLSSLRFTEFSANMRCKKIERNRSGYKLIFQDGSVRDFDIVIIATPAYITAELIPDEFGEVKELLSGIPYNSVATVNLVFDIKQVRGNLPGHGFVVSGDSELDISAATMITNKWPSRAPEDKVMIRVFLGGGKKSHIAGLSEDELKEIALKDLRRTLPFISGDPEKTQVNRFINAMPEYRPGHIEVIEKIEKALEEEKGIFFAGSWLKGIGVPDCIKTAESVAVKVKELSESKVLCDKL